MCFKWALDILVILLCKQLLRIIMGSTNIISFLNFRSFVNRLGLQTAWHKFPTDFTHIHTDGHSTSTIDHFILGSLFDKSNMRDAEVILAAKNELEKGLADAYELLK